MTKVLYETVDPVVAGSNLVVLALDFLEISSATNGQCLSLIVNGALLTRTSGKPLIQ